MSTLDGRVSDFNFDLSSGSSSFESSGFLGSGTIEGLLEDMTEFNMNDIRSLGELVVVSVLSFDRLERGDTANYTCTATNMLPQTTTLTALSPSIPLVVLGKLMQTPQVSCIYIRSLQGLLCVYSGITDFLMLVRLPCDYHVIITPLLELHRGT